MPNQEIGVSNHAFKEDKGNIIAFLTKLLRLEISMQSYEKTLTNLERETLSDRRIAESWECSMGQTKRRIGSVVVGAKEGVEKESPARSLSKS